jgi:hypothetical protein
MNGLFVRKSHLCDKLTTHKVILSLQGFFRGPFVVVVFVRPGSEHRTAARARRSRVPRPSRPTRRLPGSRRRLDGPAPTKPTSPGPVARHARQLPRRPHHPPRDHQFQLLFRPTFFLVFVFVNVPPSEAVLDGCCRRSSGIQICTFRAGQATRVGDCT